MKPIVLLSFCLAFALAAPSVTINYNLTVAFAESFAYSTSASSFIIDAGGDPTYSLAKVAPTGDVTLFVQDSRAKAADLFSLGIKVNDTKNEVYWVIANITVAFGGAYTGGVQAAFAVADITTGAVKQFIDLSNTVTGRISVNDLATDNNGIWYITDAAGGRVLWVNTSASTSGLLVEDAHFTPVPSSGNALFGIDGIIYSPSDHSLVVNNIGSGLLYKINITSQSVSYIPVQNKNLTFPDGMILGADGKVYVAQNTNPTSRVAQLTSADNWASAVYAGEATSNYPGASAVTFWGNDLFISHSAFPFPNSSVIDYAAISPLSTTSTTTGTTTTTTTSSTSANPTSTTSQSGTTTSASTTSASTTSATSSAARVFPAAFCLLVAIVLFANL